ncbi:MAG: ATP-binding protein [Lachnospiraceae bacterium]|nr:ATP-binding protein [Lachnospiraceae bacterium]
MLLGRANELQYLNTAYQDSGSRMLIVYGQKNVGKTTLLRHFTEDKDVFFYTAVPASTRQQQFMLGRKLQEKYPQVSDYPDFDEVFTMLQSDSSIERKKIYVFDEWEHMIKADTSFMDSLIRLLHHVYSENDSMIILCSSSIGFIENGLVSKIGKAALDISGFLKIKELKFVDLIRRFPSYSMEECVKLYAVLGRVPGLWEYFDPKLSVKDNICEHILKKGCFLLEEGGRFVREELRETSVYYTILSALAEGRQKLNDLYSHTGFSRAKISVYLKNLMELEIVEKIFSVDTPGRESQKKGVYRIANPYVHFWFKYIYPNFGECMVMEPQDFYNRYIKADLNTYCNEYFSEICREYMILSASKGALAIKPDRHGLFDGKEGKIDYIGQDENGKSIVAFCYYSKPMVTFEDYKMNLRVLKQARIKAEQIYLFAGGRFEEKLSLESKVKGNVILLEMDDL